jgi:hypothetical protein
VPCLCVDPWWRDAEAAAEVVALREAVNGDVSVTELASKLDQSNATHDTHTKELCIQAQKMPVLEAKVRHLKEEVTLEQDKAKKTAVIVIGEAKTMSGEYEEKIRKLKEDH